MCLVGVLNLLTHSLLPILQMLSDDCRILGHMGHQQNTVNVLEYCVQSLQSGETEREFICDTIENTCKIKVNVNNSGRLPDRYRPTHQADGRL